MTRPLVRRAARKPNETDSRLLQDAKRIGAAWRSEGR
jgi:hypothetical protein